MNDVTYYLPEIHCRACEESIRRALAPLAGISAIAVDWNRKRVLIRYEERQTNPVAIRDRIERAGFEVV
jgi:copper chaperone CopZ